MNFSNWLPAGTKDPAQFNRKRFDSICREVQGRDMPLTSYLLLHPAARLSPDDVETICQWTKTSPPPEMSLH